MRMNKLSNALSCIWSSHFRNHNQNIPKGEKNAQQAKALNLHMHLTFFFQSWSSLTEIFSLELPSQILFQDVQYFCTLLCHSLMAIPAAQAFGLMTVWSSKLYDWLESRCCISLECWFSLSWDARISTIL